MTEKPASTAYDRMPYPAAAYSQSHPDRLETLAKLFGLVSPDTRRCRVLELGCADGSNLIPMACALPGSTFVGVDLSATQIEPGLKTIAALGLSNIELRHSDLQHVDASFGMFDYVIAHGIFSWVSREVQDRLLAVCRERLVENGVAYVSYNTHPGWRMRGMLRDMMLYHSRKFDDPQKQIEQARALISWLGETVTSEGNPYGMLLKSELEQMQHWQDTYFRHDSLAEINEPVYFHQFIEQAGKQGLSYLGEAEFPSMLASNYGSATDETLNRLGRDIIEMEQYMDFLRNRMFRQTLLCHKQAKLNRSLGPWTIAGFQIAASIRPVNPAADLASNQAEAFRGPKEMTLSSDQPMVKAALVCLAEVWPAALPFAELVSRARSRLDGKSAVVQKPAEAEADSRMLSEALLTCYSKGLCELHVHPAQFVLSPGKQPLACPLVRLQASRGSAVTNRRHDRVMLDSFARHLAPLLNGERDRASLVEALANLVANDSLVVNVEGKPISEPAEVHKVMTAELERKLHDLGRLALLVA
jgi:methyltransferase-like protein/2-polyprenyl-3-methyl-5-hydroxy-6-metoxy-1,4-benzoquinol methylase